MQTFRSNCHIVMCQNTGERERGIFSIRFHLLSNVHYKFGRCICVFSFNLHRQEERAAQEAYQRQIEEMKARIDESPFLVEKFMKVSYLNER